jgi:transcriptional regulator with XRE-family HTH domain
MQHRILSVQDLGTLLRATRKSAHLRMDDLAATSGLSKQFVNDLELGKPGVQLGKVLQVLHELGAHVYLDVPDAAAAQMAHASTLIGKTTARRQARAQLRVPAVDAAPQKTSTPTPRRRARPVP